MLLAKSQLRRHYALSEGVRAIETQPLESTRMDNPTERLFRRLFYSALISLPSIIAVATFRDHSLNVSLLFWLAELLLLLILGLALYETKGRLTRPSVYSVVLSLVVLGTSLSAALLNAIDRATALGHLAITTTHFIFALAIFGLFSNAWRGERRRLLFALLLSAFLQVATTFALIGVAAGIPDFNWLYFHAAVGNVRQLGFVGITLVSLATAMVPTATKARCRLFQWFALLVGLTFINLNGGRAAFGACFFVIAFSIVMLQPEARLKSFAKISAIWLLSALLSFIYIPPHVAWGLPRILGTADQLATGADISTGRWEAWRLTMEKYVEHPWIGFGESQFVALVDFPGMAINHPHNFVFQFLFQWGLIGTAAMLGLAALIFIRSLKSSAGRVSVFLPSAALLIAMTAMASLEGNFYHVHPSMITAIALALLATVGNRQDSQDM